LSIVLTPGESEQVTSAAEDSGIPRAIWMRNVLLKAARGMK
jgi:hypothetical protein